MRLDGCGICYANAESKNTLLGCFLIGAPTGIRTPVLALKGLRPSPLDDGGKKIRSANFLLWSFGSAKTLGNRAALQR